MFAANTTFWEQVWLARWVLLNGLGITIASSILIILIGTVLGLLTGVALYYGPRPVRWAIRVVVDVIRGTPVLVILFFCFYGLSLIGLDLKPFAAGVIALAGFCVAHTAEIVRGALGSIPNAQSDAAKAIGLGFWGRLLWCLAPQALRRMLPPWINTAAEMIKGTTLLSLIGVVDLMLAAQQAVSRNLMALEFYSAALAVYVVLCLLVSRLGALVERRLAFIRY